LSSKIKPSNSFFSPNLYNPIPELFKKPHDCLIIIFISLPNSHFPPKLPFPKSLIPINLSEKHLCPQKIAWPVNGNA